MDLMDELFDRFGDVPQSVETLISVALLRNTLAGFGFREINQKAKALLLIPEHLNLEVAQKLQKAIRGRVMVNASSKPHIMVKLNAKGDVVETLEEIAGALTEQSVSA